MLKNLDSRTQFPFLFGGTFIEGGNKAHSFKVFQGFPFLFGGTFIEGKRDIMHVTGHRDFPSFSEGLSLRVEDSGARA